MVNWPKWSRRALLASPLLSALPRSAEAASVQDDTDPPFSALRPLDLTFCNEALKQLSGNDIARLNGVILEASIADLVALMGAGELSAFDLALYYLYRIRTFDLDQLNAVIDLNPHALDLAAELDAERAAGSVRGPLHGIPVLLKDNIATGEYLRTTAGAAALQDSTAHRDAFLASLLRDAGAIILGKTNLTEWANVMHYTPANGFSAVGGQVVSPYFDWLDPSGSSTGTAVAVSAGFAPLAIGTETIGSIISPAARSGVVGFKPSLGLISRDLIIPVTDEFDSAGPVSTSVADIALAMNVLAGSGDLADARSLDCTRLIGADFTGKLVTDALDGKRVAILAFDPALSDADQIALYALEDDVAALESLGAEVVVTPRSAFPSLDYGTVFSCGMHLGVDRYLASIDDPLGSLAAVVEYNVDHPEVIPYGQEHLQASVACSLTQEEVSLLGTEVRESARLWMDDLFQSTGADLILSVDELFSLEYSLSGCPAITIPRGLTYDGVPTSLTLIGPFLSDVDLLGYAYAYEQTGARRVPPPLVASILPAGQS